MNNWSECLLGNFLTLKRGYDLPNSERIVGQFPIISSSGISGSHKFAKVKGPGVVTGRYGTIGEVFYISSDFWPLNTSLYVEDFKGNFPRFVSYFLRTLDLGSQNVAGAVPGVNRNALHMMKVRVPREALQKKIAAVLSAYDDLIENNQRRIALLEKMAEELYREWFVRLRFPEYERSKIEKGVPEGWTKEKLPELAKITYGFPFQGDRFNSNGLGRPIIRIRNVPDSMTQDFTDEIVDEKYLVSAGDLLVGMDGEFHINHWSGEQAWLVQRVCRIKAKESLCDGYLAQAVVAPIKHYEATVMGATVGHLGAKHLNSTDILMPPTSFWPQLEVFNDFLKQKISLAVTNRKLGAMRDMLLPRLISGKLSLETVDIQFPPSIQDAA